MAGLPDGATGLLIDGRWRASGAGLTVTDKYTRQPFATARRSASRWRRPADQPYSAPS